MSKWVAANGVIYATTYDGQRRKGAIVAMAAGTLQNTWSISIYAVQSMAIANGRLYAVGISTGGGVMTAFGNK